MKKNIFYLLIILSLADCGQGHKTVRYEMLGFRVQLFNVTTEFETAWRDYWLAMEKFEESVYLVYEAPYYKVRVGDCLKVEEAISLKNRAIRLGFEEAWIVMSRVSR